MATDFNQINPFLTAAPTGGDSGVAVGTSANDWVVAPFQIDGLTTPDAVQGLNQDAGTSASAWVFI